jgi:uncharacterized protein
VKRFGVILILLACACFSALAAEVIPQKPDRYFNDYAGVVSASKANALNRQLEDFERATTSQILVAVYPKMQSDSSIDDYAVRVARAWQVGQKGKNNGAVLFVFVQDHKMTLQVGYGLEGAIPDATAKQIITYVIGPRFRQGDYAGGLTAGVNAILAAARGEYKGTGRTVADRHNQAGLIAAIVIIALAFIFLGFVRRAAGGGRVFHGGGYYGGGWGGGWGGGGWGGGGWGSGGGGGGGGGFSSGGGSFGGGGASGGW